MSFLYLPPLLNTEITATTQIFVKGAELWYLHCMNTDAAAATTLTCRNGTTDGSTVYFTVRVGIGLDYDFVFPNPLYFPTALRIVVAGGTCIFDIGWRKW